MKNAVHIFNPLLLLLAASAVLALLAAPVQAASGPGKTRVLLLGASVGQDWGVEGLPKRLKTDRFEYEAVQAWQFDKTEALDEVLMRPKRKFKPTKTYLKGFLEPAPVKPDAVIIKECAAYFPGDLNAYKSLVRKWVATIRADGRKPAIATVVPVTRARSLKDPGRLAAILEYNDWVRMYAATEGLPLLDLEAALRTDDKERLLKDEFATDGLHLNRKAYDILDKVLLSASEKLVAAERR